MQTRYGEDKREESTKLFCFIVMLGLVCVHIIPPLRLLEVNVSGSLPHLCISPCSQQRLARKRKSFG